MSGFCRLMFVLSFLLCLAHVAIHGFWLLRGVDTSALDAPALRKLALSHLLIVVPAALILICGVFGNLLLLAYKRAGLFFCWILVLATFAAILISMFLLNAYSAEMNAPARKALMLKGMGISALRYGWLSIYILALKRAAMFLRR